MEPKIEIINDKKKYTLPIYSSFEEIIKFIKEECKLSKQSNIDLYGNEFSSPIKSFKDLEKLKDQSNKDNSCIRITFKVRNGIRENKNITKKTPVNCKNKPIILKKINLRDIKNRFNENSYTSEVKNSLRKNIEKVDDNIKEDVKRYKQKQEEEIKSLEKELNELKRLNNDLQNENDHNIFLSNDLINNLKKDIINEIFLKIGAELKEKMKEIEKNINQEELIKKYEEYIDEQIRKKKESILHDIKAPFGEIRTKQKDIENKINKNKKAIEENQKPEKNQRQNNQNYKNVNNQFDMNNISTNLFNRGKNRNQIKDYKNQDHENIIDNEVNNLNKSNYKINQSNNNIHLFNNLVKEKPKKVDKFIVPKKNEPPLQKKKSKEIKLFDLFNNIFFKDKVQKIINPEKINDNTKNLIHKIYIKNLTDERNEIIIYAKNFIVYNVLPIFKQTNISRELLDVIKYNISVILETIGIDKNYYSNYYFPQLKKEIKNRQKSVEAAERFRKEFNIGKDVINEEVLIEKLDENNNDIYQTFGGFYGK